ncbi:MAG: PEP/pyruvate-binding domain-containing protein, partial [Candidatus Sumerlaeota bacterium]
MSKEDRKWVRTFDSLDNDDVAQVGGKNASLGEMFQRLTSEGVRLPNGFATTAEAYRRFLEENDLEDQIRETLDAMHNDEQSLEETGRKIRRMFRKCEFSDELRDSIESAYDWLCEENDRSEIDVAVRSSATAEDLPEASFAGQQETFLNVSGHDELIDACRDCYASLFTDR